MKHRLAKFLLIFGMISSPAAAQQPPFNQQQMPGQPGQQAYAAQAQVFPRLPPSRACTAGDVTGVWKLLRVYETPLGNALTDFMTNPVQYLVFNANNTYGRFIANRNQNNMPPAAVRNAVARQPGLQQYVVDSSGFVFLYQNRQAIDTQACFIVAAQQDATFAPGQMLLMPPEGQVRGRLLKVYNRMSR